MTTLRQVIVTAVVTTYPINHDSGGQRSEACVSLASYPPGDLFAAAQAEQIALDLDRIFRNRYGAQLVNVRVE